MKIEIGESLCYSWLRHVKGCQIVQTNWKVSPKWEFKNKVRLEQLMKTIAEHFRSNYDYEVFKSNASLDQLVRQGECDVLGIHFDNGKQEVYAVDVAFHEFGLNYGDAPKTTMKVIEKCARTAICLSGSFAINAGNIFFASPKIGDSLLAKIKPCIDDLNWIFNEYKMPFHFSLLANDDFMDEILVKTLADSAAIEDSNELFLRSYKMISMLVPPKTPTAPAIAPTAAQTNNNYDQLKVGEIAQHILAPILTTARVSPDEIEAMQTETYSKDVFHINFPLLVKCGSNYPIERYYKKVITAYGQHYHLCSQWFEQVNNNDRPYLLKWIASHQGQ